MSDPTPETKHSGRSMPWSEEAEQGVISGMLADPDRRVPEMQAKYPLDLFYSERNRLVVQAIYRLGEQAKPVEVLSVLQLLRESGNIERVGSSYIAEMEGHMPIPSQFAHYRALLVRDWLRRKLIEACQRGQDDALSFGDAEMEGDVPDCSQMLAQAEERVFGVLQLAQGLSEEGAGPVKASVFMADYVDHLEKVMENVGKVMGMQTSLPDVDRVICGLDDARGEMLVAGARPGHGKTAFLGTLVKNMCIDQGIPSLMFSMEMSRDQILDRIVFGGFGINTNKARTGMLSRAEKADLGNNIRKVQSVPLWIDDRAEINSVEFRSVVTMMVRQHGIRLLIVDYIQLITACTRIGKSEERLEITEALKMLHALKKKHKLIIIAAAQLNQNIEKTPGRRHMLSDFAGSDAIGKYADYALFITRPAEIKRWNDKHLTDKQKQNQIDRWKLSRQSQPELWCGHKIRDAEPHPMDAHNAGADEKTLDGDNDDLDSTMMTVRGGDVWLFNNEQDWDESAELQFVKNRNGPTPDIPIRFRREFARFDTRTPKQFSNNEAERQHK